MLVAIEGGLTGAAFDEGREPVNCGAGDSVAAGDGFASTGTGFLIKGSVARGVAANLGGSKLEE